MGFSSGMTLLPVSLPHRRRRARSGVAEDDVQPPAERIAGLVEQVADGIRVADVGGDDNRPRAVAARFGDGLFQRRDSAPGERHRKPVPQKRQRRRLPYPRPRSGYYGYSAHASSPMNWRMPDLRLF